MDALKLLDDKEVVQGVVVLSRNGQPDPMFHQDLISSAKGYYPDKQPFYILGRCGDVDNTLRDLWACPTEIYVFPTSGQQMRLVSTSTNDTSNGSNVRTVVIDYLDSNYAQKQETVTLSGITPVLTVATNILRINGMYSGTIGTPGVGAAGAISLTNTDGTVTYGLISIGLNLARQAIYTVPAGYYAYINHFQVSSGSTGSHFCQTILEATAKNGIIRPGIMIPQDEQGTQNSGAVISYPTPIRLPEKTDIKLTAISDNSAANVIALGAVFGWLELK